MISKRILAVAAAAAALAAPSAFADSVMDMDPYWKMGKVDRTAQRDTRTTQSTQTTQTTTQRESAVTNFTKYHY